MRQSERSPHGGERKPACGCRRPCACAGSAWSGQLLTVCYVYFGLGFQFAIGICLALIALTAWLNVFLRMRYSMRTRLSTTFATTLLAYDILQLAGLLYLTGGIENPFVFLIVAPVTVSAATLPPRNTIALGVLAAGATACWCSCTGRCPGTAEAGSSCRPSTISACWPRCCRAWCSSRSMSGGWRRRRGR